MHREHRLAFLSFRRPTRRFSSKSYMLRRWSSPIVTRILRVLSALISSTDFLWRLSIVAYLISLSRYLFGFFSPEYMFSIYMSFPVFLLDLDSKFAGLEFDYSYTFYCSKFMFGVADVKAVVDFCSSSIFSISILKVSILPSAKPMLSKSSNINMQVIFALKLYSMSFSNKSECWES